MRHVNWESRNVTFLAYLFLIALCLTMVVQAQQPGGVTMFEGARLITGDGSAPIADSAFVVENGRLSGALSDGALIGGRKTSPEVLRGPGGAW